MFMITFDALTLKAFVQENLKFLEGSRIQKIQQPTRRDFVFNLRNSGESKKLYININPQIYHVCFMEKDNELKRRIEIPSKPPMFCMLLRKHLENSKISRVNVPENERILEFYIETYDELNEKIHLCLAIELMGKHSNVILYNYDTNIILGCAHNVGAEKSREREVAGTLPYAYPPRQIKNDIRNYNGGIDYKSLSNDFYLFSNSFANMCSGKTLDELKNFVMLTNISPAISPDYAVYSLYEELLPEAVLQKDVNSMIDSYYAYHQANEKFNSLYNNLKTIIKQKLKRTLATIEKMYSQIKREANSEKYRLWGDLIMTNLYNSKDYSEKICVYDYENNKNIEIELDSSKTLKDNANRFYKLYTKGKTSKQKLSELLEEMNSIKMNLEQMDYFLDNAETYDDLLDVMIEIVDTQSPKEKAVIKAQEPERIDKGEFVIYIGKNNKQNDYIVSKLAKNDDLWFHTKDCPGSHVLLRGQSPTDELIYECAKLAKQFSAGKLSSKVGVIYTKSKYLRKPPKAALGYVTYKNEREIVVD